ncbi:hypothetical protein PG996_007828 [Apiospora saccharicola]|uniref:Uncharacterized protein n=1 Tax=Apiospora saccharicola TaxID=335842 RepID=A0ABR1UW63_9PEZI
MWALARSREKHTKRSDLIGAEDTVAATAGSAANGVRTRSVIVIGIVTVVVLASLVLRVLAGGARGVVSAGTLARGGMRLAAVIAAAAGTGGALGSDTQVGVQSDGVVEVM